MTWLTFSYSAFPNTNTRSSIKPDMPTTTPTKNAVSSASALEAILFNLIDRTIHGVDYALHFSERALRWQPIPFAARGFPQV
jgi:hypothetical protein